jgi:hypothetical protein
VSIRAEPFDSLTEVHVKYMLMMCRDERSDLAGKITGVTLDVTAGTTSALNYKVPIIAFVDAAAR